jgi:hypothetical protein
MCDVGGWWRLGCAVVALLGTLTACGSDPPDTAPTTTTGTPAQADRDRLAGLAAAAKDQRYVARYTLSTPSRPDRTVTVALATDGSWVVAVPAGALSGLADIAVYSSKAGLFQCLLGPASGTAGSRPDLGPLNPACVRVSRLTAATDPRVHHVFTDWIDAFTDRATALSVTATSPLPGSPGECFSVESNSAALAPPVDPGVYCYDRGGVLTGARAGFGTLALVGPYAPAPPSVAVPAPITTGTPVPVTAPGVPAPSTSAASG